MASGNRWLAMDKAEQPKDYKAMTRELQGITDKPVEEKEKLMTGETKRVIIDELIEMEKAYYHELEQGRFPEHRPYKVLAEKYGCKENKIAVIKCFFKRGGYDALVDDKVRGGFRKGAGKPSESLRKWRASRGYTKENNWGKKQ